VQQKKKFIELPQNSAPRRVKTKWKRQFIDWEKIFATDMFDKGLVSRISQPNLKGIK
jgi:hypothetical protein